MGNHRFVTNGQGYQTVTFCEWCGFIAYHANDSDERYEQRAKERKLNTNCPSTPQYVVVQPQPAQPIKDEENSVD